MSESHEVTVYSREQCHLCDEALETIEAVAASVESAVEIEEVDVDEDPDLAAEYGDRVPYVFVDGRPAFKFRVDESELRSRLEG
jgi:glutaredoxin